MAICRLDGRLLRAVASLSCLLIGWVAGRSGVALPWAMPSALSMVPVFLLGNMASPHMRRLPAVARSRRLSLAFSCCVVVTACLLLNGAVNVREAKFGNPIAFMTGAVCGTALMCVLAVELVSVAQSHRVKSWILDIGMNTIVVLYFHRWFQGVVLTLLDVAGLSAMGKPAAYVLRGVMFSACVCLSSYVIHIVNGYVPWLIGRCKANHEAETAVAKV